MFERFAASARDAVKHAVAEAHRRGDRRVGTEHLLLGLLHDPPIEELLGFDLEAARRGARTLDQQALAAIGINVDGNQSSTTAALGGRAPLTSGSRATLQRGLRIVAATKAPRIETTHLLRALLERDVPDPAATLLTALGKERSQLLRRLRPREPR